jgi:hypothetical protein
MMGSGRRYFNDWRQGTAMAQKRDEARQADMDVGLTSQPKEMPPAARRALAEAAARRREYLTREKELPKEIGGRGGNDPARYGDWELNGRSVDF